MFGYVTIYKDELKIREYDRYRSFYCGLCYSLRSRFGLKGQMLLPNDMAFMDILLNALYEEPLKEEDRRCMVHPVKKQHLVYNRITDYTADMGLLLAYYKMMDDIRDDNSGKAKLYAGTLEKSVKALSEKYPRQAKSVRIHMDRLHTYETNREYDLDAVAGLTGSFLGELFVYKEDEWAPVLRRLGFFLGKFIYLMDGFEDLIKDEKKGSYNPWTPYRTRPDFEAIVENTLTMMMAECARAFERLPIVQDVELLRNILYSGVWVRYRLIKKQREDKAEGEA